MSAPAGMLDEERGGASRNRRVHVAIVSPYDLAVPGGVQAHVIALGNALVAGGDRVTLVSPGVADDPPTDDVDERVAVVRAGAVVTIAFNDSRAPITLDPRVLGALHRVLDETGADVVHVHEPAVPMVGLAAAHYDAVPVVGTFHAWSDRDRAYRLARPVLGRMVAGLDGRIAVSAAARSYHAGALGLDEERFAVVPNGVDVARFRDAEPFERDHDDRVVLFLGRLEERKGVRDLAAAFVALAEDRDDVRLVVVGDGPDREDVEATLAPLGDRVTLTGRVPFADVARWYRTADVYVAPAVGGESFGIVLLEAMAAGTRVVATDIPGYRSVVDTDNAVLAPPDDAAGLADAVAAALDEDAATAAARDAAASATAEEHDWTRVAARVRSCYVRALEAAAAATR